MRANTLYIGIHGLHNYKPFDRNCNFRREKGLVEGWLEPAVEGEMREAGYNCHKLKRQAWTDGISSRTNAPHGRVKGIKSSQRVDIYIFTSGELQFSLVYNA